MSAIMGMVPAVLPAPASNEIWQGAPKTKEHAMSQNLNSAVAVIGIDIEVRTRSMWSAWMIAALLCLRQEVVAWSDRSTASQFAAVPDRHGGLRWCASSPVES